MEGYEAIIIISRRHTSVPYIYVCACTHVQLFVPNCVCMYIRNYICLSQVPRAINKGSKL